MAQTAFSLRERALRFLARREYSRAELARKLMALVNEPGELEPLLDSLQADNLQSDARYAAAYIAVHAAQRGNRALIHALQQQGVSNDVIDIALDEAGSELVRARIVWQKRFKSLPQSLDEKGKQIRFLSGRGFSNVTIHDVLQINKEAQHDN